MRDLSTLQLDRHGGDVNLIVDKTDDSNLDYKCKHDPDRSIEVHSILIFEELGL